MAGLGQASTPRTIRPGDEDAGRRHALHAARADNAAAEGRLREAQVTLSVASAALYSSPEPDDPEAARERAYAAHERVIAARADLAIVAAAVERLGGLR